MDRFARIMALHRVLAERRLPVTVRELQDELECSAATVKRAIRELRYTVGAPIVAEPDGTGYRYDRESSDQWQLPGLWFTSQQLHALATIDHLLTQLAPSILGPLLDPVRERIHLLLGKTDSGKGELTERIRVLPMAARAVGEHVLAPVAAALQSDRRLNFRYMSEPREVSPQRLVHYRDNWYLDAWCHQRNALRTFALSRMESVSSSETQSDTIPKDQLDAHFCGAYGIFAGRPDKEALLRFRGATAERVAEERWHPDQRASWLEDGRYELRVPYRDPRELVLDIMRHGPEVEVAAPLDLREEIQRRHQAAAALYE